jgi:hypothetical protein
LFPSSCAGPLHQYAFAKGIWMHIN